MPTTIYLPEGGQESAHVTPRRLTFPADEASESIAEQSTRVASRLCSFVCQLEQHLGWLEGRQTSRFLESWPTPLSGKRKHMDANLTSAREVPPLGPLQKRQIIFLSFMIRNYTNDCDGSPSSRTLDADHACVLIWNYLTRTFPHQVLDAVLLQTLTHAKVLLSSEFTPAQVRNLMQNSPPGGEEWWQGKTYFPYDLRLQDIHQLDLEEYDFRMLKRASLQLRLLQQPKTISASSPTSASDQLRDSLSKKEISPTLNMTSISPGSTR